MTPKRNTGGRPRIRTFKPERYQDERLAGVPRDARHLYDGLTTQADDEGRGTANPAVIKGTLMPFDDDVTPAVVAEWLAALDQAGLIELYEADDRRFYFIASWFDDQRVQHATASKLPPPPSLTIPQEPSIALVRPLVGPDRTGPDQDRTTTGPDLEREASRDGYEQIANLLPGVATDRLAAVLAEHPSKDLRDAGDRLAAWSAREALKSPLGALQAVLRETGDYVPPAPPETPEERRSRIIATARATNARVAERNRLTPDQRARCGLPREVA